MKKHELILTFMIFLFVLPVFVVAELLPCPDCKNNVSSYADACPKCGCPASRIKANQAQSSTAKKRQPDGKACAACRGRGHDVCTYCRRQDLTKLVCTYCRGQDLTKQMCTYCGGKDLTKQQCQHCNGSGRKQGKACAMCSGTGRKKPCVMCSATGRKKPCLMCGATGKQKPCVMCGAKGIVVCADCNGSGKHVEKQVPVRRGALTTSVIESQIEDEFDGWEGETIVKLMNGQIWQQTEYYYHYHYAFMPKVLVYKSHGQWKMKVDGIDRAVGVEQLK